MSLTRKYAVVLIGCMVMIGLTASGAFARGSSQKGMNAEQLAQMAADIHEINNLMSLHSWYHAASMNDVELDEIWAKRDDIVWAQNSGQWIGHKSIKEYYGQTVKREATKGSFVWHTITTPIVEVAADRQTAKGVWYTPGVVGSYKNDKGDFMWMFEKYGVDFIREDGVWKVWHMHVYTDTAWPLGGEISAKAAGPAPGGAPSPAASGAPKAEGVGQEGGDSGGMQAPMKGPDKSGPEFTSYKELSPTTELKLVPRPPVPYKTFSETWSYVGPGE